jgi:hypothetical protein
MSNNARRYSTHLAKRHYKLYKMFMNQRRSGRMCSYIEGKNYLATLLSALSTVKAHASLQLSFSTANAQ